MTIAIWIIVGVLGSVAASTLFLALAGMIHRMPYDMSFHTYGR
jgi:hypothetical protein